MRKLLVVFVLLLTTVVKAQEKGTITGTVTDKEMNNESLPFANVFIKGTTVGATTDFDGKYSLNVNEGNVIVVFSFVGYKTMEVPVTVVAGKTQTINQLLSASEGVTMDEVMVKATVSREKESALLTEQKKAVVMKVAIGAQELSRKGVGNVAAAVTKIAGISKQEGSGSIFVRGLGDRYNTTTLNGLPLPSNNPSNKNLDLNIFSTDVVETIDVSKTYETGNYGDFGGANINIKSKNFRGSPYVKLSLGLLSVNSNAASVDNFYLQDGPNRSGFSVTEIPVNPLSPSNYATSWDRKKSKSILNQSFGVSAGRSFEVGEVGKINTFITASFKSDSKFREGVVRGGVDVQGDPRTDYAIESFSYDTNTTLMGTVNYKINDKHTIGFNSLYLNSTNQKYGEYRGTNEEFDGGNAADDTEYGIVQRGTFDKTQLFVNQLVGKHNFTERLVLDWAGGVSVLNNDIPDRIQNSFVPSRDGSDNFTFYSNSAIDNHRYYQKLKENELSANVSVGYKFDQNEEEEFNGIVKIGYSGRFKNVDFNSNQYDFNVKNNAFNFAESETNNVDNYLNITSFNAGLFNINSINQEYFGDQFIHSFIVSGQYQFTEKLTVIAGVRGESILQSIGYKTTLEPSGKFNEFTEFQFLPSVSAKYGVTDKQNLKFAGSKTYTLPQYKEKVELLFEEVTQGYVGNPNLYTSTNYNFDLGWELFPNSGELISVTTFGKIIQNPINEIFVNSASGDISYVNSGDKATVLGVEFELKKKLLEFDGKNDFSNKLSFGLNVSYMNSNQDFNSAKVSAENDLSADFTYADGKLTGASDLLINSDISYFKEISEKANLMATLSYGYFSDKVKAIGTQGRGHLVDKGNSSLDFIVKSELTKKLKLGLSVKNILDPSFERIQEAQNVVVSSYKRGVNCSLSLSYKF